MQLDDNVCRGSLIIHKEERLVVIGRGVGLNPDSGYWRGTTQFAGWRVIPVSDLRREEIPIAEIRVLKDGTEVDCFFPGIAYEVPDYIR